MAAEKGHKSLLIDIWLLHYSERDQSMRYTVIYYWQAGLAVKSSPQILHQLWPFNCFGDTEFMAEVISPSLRQALCTQSFT